MYGLGEAVDANAVVFSQDVERLRSVVQVSAASVIKTDQMKDYFGGSRKELKDALQQIADIDQAHRRKFMDELNVVSATIKKGFEEVEGTLGVWGT